MEWEVNTAKKPKDAIDIFATFNMDASARTRPQAAVVRATVETGQLVPFLASLSFDQIWRHCRVVFGWRAADSISDMHQF